jgi:hypothetical protein
MDGTRSGWLVIAISPKGREFPTYLCASETPAEAIAWVRRMGFCFGSEWDLRAVRATSIEGVELGGAAKVATHH